MNAIQPSRPPLEPVETGRANPRKRRHRRRYPYQVMVLETTAKLAVKIVLSVAAVSALVKILPYQLSQQQKLGEIQTEVKLREGRVNHLQTDFSRYFDPQQEKSVMQEESNRFYPEQRQVVLLDKAGTIEAPALSRKKSQLK